MLSVCGSVMLPSVTFQLQQLLMWKIHRLRRQQIWRLRDLRTLGMLWLDFPYPPKGWSNFPYRFLNPFGKRISLTPPTHHQILSTSRQKPIHLEPQWCLIWIHKSIELHKCTLHCDNYFNSSTIEVFVFMNFTFFKWTGFWDPTILSDRFFRPTHPPKSFRRKDWETRMEYWTTPNHYSTTQFHVTFSKHFL